MNRKMATLALTIALSGLGSAAAFAQDEAQGPPQAPMGAGQQAGHRWGPQDPEVQIQHMQRQLGLSADQVAQIRPILMDARSQAMAARQDASLVGADRQAKMASIHQGMEAKLMAILNPEQQAKYQAMRAQMMQRGGRMQGGPEGGPPPQQ